MFQVSSQNLHVLHTDKKTSPQICIQQNPIKTVKKSYVETYDFNNPLALTSPIQHLYKTNLTKGTKKMR